MIYKHRIQNASLWCTRQFTCEVQCFRNLSGLHRIVPLSYSWFDMAMNWCMKEFKFLSSRWSDMHCFAIRQYLHISLASIMPKWSIFRLFQRMSDNCKDGFKVSKFSILKDNICSGKRSQMLDIHPSLCQIASYFSVTSLNISPQKSRSFDISVFVKKIDIYHSEYFFIRDWDSIMIIDRSILNFSLMDHHW